MSRRWVCFDVGEVLVDEGRIWGLWGEHLGLPPATFVAVLGGAIARAGDHKLAFEVLGVTDWRERNAAVEEAYGGFSSQDLYPDAIPAIEALKAAGYGVAVIGNQPARRHGELAALGVAPDVLAMSEEIGAEKPSPAFFARALALMGDPPASDVVYVGDRVDNDLRPAAAAGLRPVWIRRGPWGWLMPDTDGVAVLHVDDLFELVRHIDAVWHA